MQVVLRGVRLGAHVVLSIPVDGRNYGCHQGDVCLNLWSRSVRSQTHCALSGWGLVPILSRPRPQQERFDAFCNTGRLTGTGLWSGGPRTPKLPSTGPRPAAGTDTV